MDLQVFDPTSELYNFSPDFVFINRCTEKLMKDFYKTDKTQQGLFSEYVANTTQQYYDTITQRMRAKLIINTYPEINDGVFGNFAAKINMSFLYQQRKTNIALMDLGRQLKDLFICDLGALQSELRYRFVFDPKM